MKYRHEQMVRAREHRKAQREERQREAEAALWASLSGEQRRLWLVFSEAVAKVQTAGWRP